MSPYINWRNEAVRFERLLASACECLSTDSMPPEVAKYWNAKKTLALMERAKGTEFGALQIMLAEEEGR